MCFIHADDALFDVIITTSWRIKVNFREQLTIWIQNVQINRKTRSKQDDLCIIKPLLQVIISCPSKTSVISICNACCLQLLWTLLSVCPPHWINFKFTFLLRALHSRYNQPLNFPPAKLAAIAKLADFGMRGCNVNEQIGDLCWRLFLARSQPNVTVLDCSA